MDKAESDFNARRKRKTVFAKEQAKFRPSEAVITKHLNDGEEWLSKQRSVTFDIGAEDRATFDEFQALPGEGKNSSPADRKRAKKLEQSTMDHFRNGIWVISACLLYSYLDVPRVLTTDHRVKYPVFLAGLTCTAVFLAISIYHVVWLSWVKRLDDSDWEKVFPSGVPVATGAIILSAFLYVIAFWSIWSVFTPVILFAFTMPVVVLLSYI